MTPNIHEVIISVAPTQHTDWCHCNDFLTISCRQCCHQVPQVYYTVKSTLGSYYAILHYMQRVNELRLARVLHVLSWKLEFQHRQTEL